MLKAVTLVTLAPHLPRPGQFLAHVVVEGDPEPQDQVNHTHVVMYVWARTRAPINPSVTCHARRVGSGVTLMGPRQRVHKEARGTVPRLERVSRQTWAPPRVFARWRVVLDKRMDFRYLGASGLKISEITYGNWLTHGSQVENDTATKCVRAALDAGISTFDTADVYANTKAETVLGEALKGERRESLEIFTKVFGPTGPKGHNDVGLSRKHILEAIDGSLARLQTDYVDLYQAHRYDYETPLEETMQAFADIARQGKVLYFGVSEWTAEQLRAGHALAQELGVQLISNQPQYSMLWRVIEDEVVPASIELGVSQVVWSPIAQGVLTGKYLPGQHPPSGSRATDEKGGADMIQRFMNDDVLTRVQALQPVADGLGLSMAQLAIAWVLQNNNVATAIIGASRPDQVHENVKAAGVRIPAEALSRIDAALGDIVERDPAKTLDSSPKTREA
jgi:aryl-alcohol dehydrogenase-like predicted oxidoreductase